MPNSKLKYMTKVSVALELKVIYTNGDKISSEKWFISPL